MDQCYNHQCYTYAKRPFAGPLAVIRYLGNYTHRIAISDSQIIQATKKRAAGEDRTLQEPFETTKKVGD